MERAVNVLRVKPKLFACIKCQVNYNIHSSKNIAKYKIYTNSKGLIFRCLRCGARYFIYIPKVYSKIKAYK